MFIICMDIGESCDFLIFFIIYVSLLNQLILFFIVDFCIVFVYNKNIRILEVV